jgi:hypothetical protein
VIEGSGVRGREDQLHCGRALGLVRRVGRVLGKTDQCAIQMYMDWLEWYVLVMYRRVSMHEEIIMQA